MKSEGGDGPGTSGNRVGSCGIGMRYLIEIFGLHVLNGNV